MDQISRNKDKLRSQMRRLFKLLSLESDHVLEEVMACVDCSTPDFRRLRYHCDSENCVKLLNNYTYAIVESAPIVSPQNLKTIEYISPPALDLQHVNIKNVGEYDYSYDVGDLSLRQVDVGAIVLVMVGDDKSWIDCVFSSAEDNIDKKPHHYRRAYASSLGIVLQNSKEKGNLMVEDSRPYIFGGRGGYFELPSNFVRCNVFNVRDQRYAHVVSTGASGSTYVRVGVTTSPLGWCKLNADTLDFVSKSSTLHYHDDYLTIINRAPIGVHVVDNIRSIDGIRIDIRVRNATGVGMRNSLRGILSMYAVKGCVYNSLKDCCSQFICNVPDRDFIIGHLTRYVRYKGYMFDIIAEENMGPMKIEIGVYITVGQ